MKKLLTIIFIAFSFTAFSQPMLVTKAEVKPDPAWQDIRNNFHPLSEYISSKISESTIDGDSVRVQALITVKREIWEAIRKFRNATVDSAIVVVEVDSLQTMKIIERNTAEIAALKVKINNCAECDKQVLQNVVNLLQQQKNEAVKNSKNWIHKN